MKVIRRCEEEDHYEVMHFMARKDAPEEDEFEKGKPVTVRRYVLCKSKATGLYYIEKLTLLVRMVAEADPVVTIEREPWIGNAAYTKCDAVPCFVIVRHMLKLHCWAAVTKIESLPESVEAEKVEETM